MREVELLKDGWKFVHVKKGTSLRFLSNAVAEWRKQIPVSIKSESDWEDVCIPHDWDIRGPFLESHSSGTSGGYAPCGLGWYRKSLDIDSKDKGKKIFLRFDGVYKRATLWLNGKRISKHYYGYGPFEVDITDLVNF